MSEFALHPQLVRDCVPVADLELCHLLLMNDSQFPWCILVPRRAGIREIHELSVADQALLLRESSSLSRAMMQFFHGEKMNIAALGNIVPQLHVHHIVRHRDDPAWPKPVWGFGPALEYEPERLQQIGKGLGAILDQY